MAPAFPNGILMAAAALALCAADARAQSDTGRAPGGPFVVIGGAAEERLRLSQLRGEAPTDGFLLRSPSQIMGSDARTLRRWRIVPVAPQLAFVNNSDLAYSMNDGALWAGKGASLLVRGGAAGAWGPLRVTLVPELTYAQNRDYPLFDPAMYPIEHPELNPYGSPWFYQQGRMDFPLRMGARPLRKLTPGQSAVSVTAGPVAIGAATENHWWGPGMWNALLLSNNAPGFTHAFLRTSRPLRTPVGAFEGRWLVGGLEESDYYDFEPANDLRSISLLGITWQPWFDDQLTLGAARAVYSGADGWGDVFGNAGQVFADAGTPNARPWLDQDSASPGRDQLLSLFFRWVLPAAGTLPGEGAEVYGEWGRMEMPRSLRDFLYEPHHTQAYVLGAQWLGPRQWGDGQFRARGELSHLEMSATYRMRPVGTWYASRAVEQGYTNRGQSLGAAIGPGSSSQHLSAGYVTDKWIAEALLTRIRWQNDVQAERINYNEIQGWCEHDVSMLGGVRGSVTTPVGTASLSYLGGKRYNPFFSPRQPSCPGTNLGDIRNHTISLTFESALPRF